MKTYHCYNLIYYTPKLWEKIVLWFCPLEEQVSDTSTVWYKKFSNRLYIYGYIRVAPGETYTTGNNSTQGYENAENN